MWVLPFVGYIGVILGFCFLTLAIASGLYYLSELVEEHSVITKKLLTRLIYGIIVTLSLLCVVDGFPLALSALAIISHIVYLQNLRSFPLVQLTDPLFILSCILVLSNHYFFFSHFQKPPPKSEWDSYRYNRYSQETPPAFSPQPTFNEVASFFGICVWLVPFTLFISLSAGDNVLPTASSMRESSSSSGMGLSGSDGKGSKGMGGMAKQVINGVREWIGETWDILVGKGGRARPLGDHGKRFQ